MQLVYFWSEKSNIDLDTLKNREINFNSSFQFKLTIKNGRYILEREKEKEKQLPNNFFGKGISNISCIIGNNGSGKTTLIKDILFYQYFTVFKPKLGANLSKHIFIYEGNNIFYIYKNFSNLEINLPQETYVANNELHLTSVNLNTKYIYFSPSFNTDFLSKNLTNNIYDISTRRKLEDTYVKIDIGKTNSETLINYKYVDGRTIIKKYNGNLFRNILNFIIENETIINSIPYRDFKEKLLKLKNKSKIICDFNLNNFFFEKPNIEIIRKNLFKKINDDELSKNNSFNNILLKFWEYITFKLTNDITSNKIEKNIINKIIKREKNEDIKKWLDSTFEVILQNIFSYQNKMEAKNNPSTQDYKFYPSLSLDEFDISYIKDIITFLLSSNKKIKFNNNRFTFSYKNNQALFNKLLKWYRGYELYLLEFEEKFSSGELEFLNLIVKLNNIGNDLTCASNIIFFFEELETFMHPEWQRKIIDFLPSLKDSLPWLKGKNIQIILTSHTPFIVGDLPEKNIIFLNQNNQSIQLTKTFGSNIYDLFKDNFLLESCFGEFSRKKIKKVIDLLSKNKEDKYNTEEIEKNITEIEFIIDSIGEPLIKNRLERMYNEYKEFKNKKTIKNADFYTYLKKNNLNLDDVLKILEERKNDKTI